MVCFPLLDLLRGGRVAVRLFYKSRRGGCWFFPLSPLRPRAFAYKLPLSPSSHLQALVYAHLPPHSAMVGDDMWPACNVTEVALRARVLGGLLRPITDEDARMARTSGE